jgi:hypothetical protein
MLHIMKLTQYLLKGTFDRDSPVRISTILQEISSWRNSALTSRRLGVTT